MYNGVYACCRVTYNAIFYKLGGILVSSVLLIDDDLKWLNILEEYLLENGISKVGKAKDLKTTIEELKNCAYDYIIIDMYLDEDEYGGLKILKKINKKTSAHIIILSGERLQHTILTQVFDNGAIGYELKEDWTNIPNKLKQIEQGRYIQTHIVIESRVNRLSSKDKVVINNIISNKKVKDIANETMSTKESIYQQLYRIKNKIKMPLEKFLKYYNFLK